ncbi:expressed unknown protein [Seminavis robusta]|uniref:Uncharacterized protein n=1 Tax=Seminavis robusta TaxID=568900 RepID=A0A9N8EGK9_9STRA|nr:expressed unknown protein [Seminavis robusta]|eukprot:Sro1097_g240850.1 n/a (875) ;mRNA; r:12680-15304
MEDSNTNSNSNSNHQGHSPETNISAAVSTGTLPQLPKAAFDPVTAATHSCNAPRPFTATLPKTLEPRGCKMATQDPHSRSEEAEHKPPMSVVVVSTSSAPRQNNISDTTRRSSPPTSIFSKPFRLQPRSTMTASTTGRDGAIRGRKRSAHSMDTSSLPTAREALLTVKALPMLQPKIIPGATATENPPPVTVDQQQRQTVLPPVAMTTPNRQGLTPPRDKRRMDHAMVNFQCLSLQSPKRKDFSRSPPKSLPSPPPTLMSGFGRPPSSSSSSCGTAPQRPAMVPGSVSSTGQPRSSFTPVYNSASPCGSLRSFGSGSIGSNTRMNMVARASASSPGGCGSSVKSSPKLAPLTVLKHSKSSQREGNSGLPPLPGGGMSSLWLSLDSSAGSSSNGGDENNHNTPPKDDPKMWPPRTVHCRQPSCDSISTVHNSVLSPLPRPSPMMSPRIFSSPASGPPPGIPTPRSKQRRMEESPGLQRTPRTPQTPLPRVTLTPRSTSSRHSRQSGHRLPRFPSPSDIDMDVTSPFLNSTAAASLRGTAATTANRPEGNTSGFVSLRRPIFPASSNSLALSADGSTNEGKDSSVQTEAAKKPLPVLWCLPMKAIATSPSDKTSLPSAGEFSGGSFMGVQTKSLLTPSKSGGILQAMMEEKHSMNGDMGSVSDIDEDECFVLASPSAIEQERFASYQPARQRRRRSCDRTSPDSPNESNTNLAGMNYVTSSTSLFGMDIAHPTDCNNLTDRKTTNDESPSSPKQSSGPLGKDQNNSRAQEYQSMKRRKSDASNVSIGLALDSCTSGDGGRDLVTPPAMPNPQTPPPLSPKQEDFMPVIMPHGTVYHHAASQAASVCVAGADRQSVTMAIARMAFEAHYHSGSSPVS